MNPLKVLWIILHCTTLATSLQDLMVQSIPTDASRSKTKRTDGYDSSPKRRSIENILKHQDRLRRSIESPNSRVTSSRSKVPIWLPRPIRALDTTEIIPDYVVPKKKVLTILSNIALRNNVPIDILLKKVTQERDVHISNMKQPVKNLVFNFNNIDESSTMFPSLPIKPIIEITDQLSSSEVGSSNVAVFTTGSTFAGLEEQEMILQSLIQAKELVTNPENGKKNKRSNGMLKHSSHEGKIYRTDSNLKSKRDRYSMMNDTWSANTTNSTDKKLLDPLMSVADFVFRNSDNLVNIHKGARYPNGEFAAKGPNPEILQLTPGIQETKNGGIQEVPGGSDDAKVSGILLVSYPDKSKNNILRYEAKRKLSSNVTVDESTFVSHDTKKESSTEIYTASSERNSSETDFLDISPRFKTIPPYSVKDNDVEINRSRISDVYRSNLDSMRLEDDEPSLKSALSDLQSGAAEKSTSKFRIQELPPLPLIILKQSDSNDNHSSFDSKGMEKIRSMDKANIRNINDSKESNSMLDAKTKENSQFDGPVYIGNGQSYKNILGKNLGLPFKITEFLGDIAESLIDNNDDTESKNVNQNEDFHDKISKSKIGYLHDFEKSLIDGVGGTRDQGGEYNIKQSFETNGTTQNIFKTNGIEVRSVDDKNNSSTKISNSKLPSELSGRNEDNSEAQLEQSLKTIRTLNGNRRLRDTNIKSESQQEKSNNHKISSRISETNIQTRRSISISTSQKNNPDLPEPLASMMHADMEKNENFASHKVRDYPQLRIMSKRKAKHY